MSDSRAWTFSPRSDWSATNPHYSITLAPGCLFPLGTPLKFSPRSQPSQPATRGDSSLVMAESGLHREEIVSLLETEMRRDQKSATGARMRKAEPMSFASNPHMICAWETTNASPINENPNCWGNSCGADQRWTWGFSYCFFFPQCPSLNLWQWGTQKLTTRPLLLGGSVRWDPLCLLLCAMSIPREARGERKAHGFGERQVWIPAWALTESVTLGKSWHRSEPQFPHL